MLSFLLGLLNCLLLLFLLLLLVHGQGDELEQFLILDRVLSLEERLVEGETSQGGGFTLGDHHCDLELSDECAWFLDEDWIGYQEFVVKTFLETESGDVGILEAVQTETEGRISAEHVVEELSALFDFQIVGSVE